MVTISSKQHKRYQNISTNSPGFTWSWCFQKWWTSYFLCLKIRQYNLQIINATQGKSRKTYDLRNKRNKQRQRQRLLLCETVPINCRSVKPPSGQMQKTANSSQQFFLSMVRQFVIVFTISLLRHRRYHHHHHPHHHHHGHNRHSQHYHQLPVAGAMKKSARTQRRWRGCWVTKSLGPTSVKRLAPRSDNIFICQLFSSSVFVFCLLLFSLQSHQFEMTGKHFHFYVSVFFLFPVFRMSHIFTFVYSSSMIGFPTIFRSIHFNAFNNRIICATDFLILDEIFFHILSHCCLLNHLSSWWSLLNNFSYLWKFFTLSWQKQRRTAAASWRRPQVLFQNFTFSFFTFWFSMLAKVLFQNFTFLFFLLQFFVFTSIKPELSLFWNKLCDISCSRDKYLHLSCVLLLF